MEEAEMGNMEARTRSALILVAFEVELLLSCSVKTTICSMLLVLYSTSEVCTLIIAL